MPRYGSLSIVLVTATLAHLAIFAAPWLIVQAAAALLLAGILPGVLLVEILVGRSVAPPTRSERILYSIASGYAIIVMVMLLVSYLPGGIERWQTLLAFDGVLAVLVILAGWRVKNAGQRNNSVGGDTQQASPQDIALPDPVYDRPLVIAGLIVLLCIGLFTRFGNLGYSEFQGDEARAALRAAAIIQGVEDTLLIHKKGPTEILLPAVIYSLTGHLNEATARLPFTIANLTAFFAIFLLGSRLLGPLAGWIGAFLLVFDGYLIGFSQIVQYQSIILLTSALALIIVHRVYRQPQAIDRYLTLAAILLATGLLSHYEGAAVGLPIAFLLGMALWQKRIDWRRLLGAAIPGLLIGAALVALFYVPFLLHPHFQATYTYLVDRRFGGDGSIPYNNLGDFFLRTAVYNSTYYAVVMIVLATLALLLAYRRGLSQRWALIASVVVVLVLALTFWRSDWLRFGAVDFIFAPFVAAFVLVWLLPRLSAEERALWLWFGASLILAFFLTSKPRSHVYIFFTPWALLAGSVVALGWRKLQQQTNRTIALMAGAVAVTVATVVFGLYVYWYFIHNHVEVLRTWPTHHPTGYWQPYDEPDDKALFGFPLANGWKVVGALYDQGVIQGDFETNEKEAWVPAWYTRGAERCGRLADWYFEIDNLEPWGTGDQLAMEHFLRGGFEKWGKVEINGVDRMIIYKRTGLRAEFPNHAPTEGLQTFSLEDYELTYDLLASPFFTLTYPTVEMPISNPLRINLGDQIWLEGYDIRYPEPLRAGDTIHLTLYWRAQQPIFANYKVFNQSYFGDGDMVAQKDGYPVCDTRETWRWDPGELVADTYDIPVNENAPDGLYPLYTGMYIEETFERLPVFDEDGSPVETQVHLTDIRVGEEP